MSSHTWSLFVKTNQTDRQNKPVLFRLLEGDEPGEFRGVDGVHRTARL